ncbi:MAG TPA: hypothetical protein VN436_04785, partial [Holophaga sp.]|nr:hypothetical protein [Holophaga sp.]
MIRLWLCNSDGGGSEDANRYYDLVVNVVAKASCLRLTMEDGGTRETNRISLISVNTTEAMAGHSAQLAFAVSAPFGDRLRRCILSQDMLLVEALQPDGTWDTIFDGFVSEVRWNREASQQGYTYRFNLACEGAHRLINSSWINWQGLLRSTNGLIGAVGAQLIKEWSVDTGAMDPAAMVKRLLDDGIGRLLNIKARYRTITTD